jgi:tetratricopeptide (TPR) repeat protein/S1-C subfamily serine protease
MRAMAYRLRLMTTICSLCLFSVPTIVFSPQALSAERVGQSSGQSSAESIKALAKAFTVKVFAGQQRGSGVILAKSGQRYTVVTNAHVIDRGQPYRIQTSDGKTYTAVLKSKGDAFKGNDLAVLEFSTTANYSVAQWGDSGEIKGAEPLFAVGFPEGENQLLVSTGQVSLMAEKALLGGYRIGFSNETRQGMSGGALLNAQGKVIGILGQGNQAILERAYTYQDGSKPTAKVLQQMRESSFAVPIATVRQMIPPAKIVQTPQTLSKPQSTSPQTRPAKPVYTGVSGEVDRIAGQITVRIQGKKEHGSGVIVAKEGNTYTVLTARHVVDRPDIYRVITADGKEYVIVPMTIRFQKDPLKEDLAVVQFSSSNSYRVATLSTAQSKNGARVFVSGFPTKQFFKRVLTTGLSVSEFGTELVAKESYSLEAGVNFLYTNMSYHGMSGGPVLDVQGRVVAINSGAEYYLVASKETESSEALNAGYSLGVPISSFIRLLDQFALEPQQLTIEKTRSPEIPEIELNRIRSQLRTMPEPGQSGTVMDWFNYANQAFRLEDYEKAISACDRAIQMQSDFYHAYYLRGMASSGLKKYAEAVIALERVTQIAPDFYQAWRWKGLLLNGQKRYSEALLSYQKAIQAQTQKNIKDYVLYFLQGEVLANLERYEEAIVSYSKGIDINPYTSGYLFRGNAYTQLEQFDKALADFNKAIALQPDSAIAYYLRGETYIYLEQYNKALSDFNTAIALQPDLSLAYSARGRVNNALEQAHKAIADYSKVIALQPDDVEAYYDRGETYINLYQYDKAVADYSRVVSLQPGYGIAYYRRGLAYKELEQYEEAITDFNIAINLMPGKDFSTSYIHIEKKEEKTYYNQLFTPKADDAIGYYNRGEIYREQRQQYDKAIADLSKAISLQPNFAAAYYKRGFVYAILKQYDKAISDFTKATTLVPNFAAVYYNRGVAYGILKQYDRAASDYTKLIALLPSYPLAYQNRGAIHLELKQYDKAMLDFRKAYLLAQQQDNTVVVQAAKRGIELLQSNK